ncbi:hypothetical protein K438DRAFT_1783934 [Mycena galopus ATCC 62051]|nr:hypothetical protein K438DRAFT_1783934 [Mycena galopus ATCC 62051]
MFRAGGFRLFGGAPASWPIFAEAKVGSTNFFWWVSWGPNAMNELCWRTAPESTRSIKWGTGIDRVSERCKGSVKRWTLLNCVQLKAAGCPFNWGTSHEMKGAYFFETSIFSPGPWQMVWSTIMENGKKDTGLLWTREDFIQCWVRYSTSQ